MDRAFVNAHCATLPGAELDDPWGGGHDAWKVGGKMFACIGMANDGVSVKCADVENAQFLIEIGAAQKAKYFHRSWVRVPFDGKAADEFQDRIHASYTLIRASLPKKVQTALAPGPATAD